MALSTFIFLVIYTLV